MSDRALCLCDAQEVARAKEQGKIDREAKKAEKAENSENKRTRIGHTFSC